MTTAFKDPLMTVRIESGSADRTQFTFSATFRIGRHESCGLQLHDDVVSRQHVELKLENDQWWLQDLGSANGVFYGDQRIQGMPITAATRIRLGISGPSLLFTPEASLPEEQPPIQPAAIATQTSEVDDLSHYKQHYFNEKDTQDAGLHTIMVRRAYAEVKKKQRWIYLSIITVISLLLVLTGALAWYKHSQVKKQRKLAAEIFYTMRSLEIDLVKLRVEAEKLRSQEAKAQMDAMESRKRQLERNYERYVDTLDVYRKGLSEQERIILRIAHKFGECEINMPKGFVQEVEKYINKWKSGQRLENAIKRAQRRNYIPEIVKDFAENDLPPQFLYLALQESNLNPRACGPRTRFGIAKGMWQFIPATAEKYGLRVGPLKDQPVVDLLDERHSFTRSTLAAAHYIRDIYTTDAQASGLLVMASYNWGEDRVLGLIKSLPANPRERNFWQLISKYRDTIPAETYDYVFSIFAAAVIGENPRLFGFDFDNPLALRNRPG